MRHVLYALSVLMVVALAFWAYNEGYKTRATARDVQRLKIEIGRRHEELAVLRAEWAYLNRPERLRELAEMNFERLGLMPLTAEHYGLVEQVAYPAPVPATLPWDEAGAALGEKIGGIAVLRHEYGADAAPALIAPPTLADDGEQLP
ncbi:hypothetical protein [Jannaschia sp. W003]|uniref:cell division protein FtsL n=1 Tax=Jannaschia sp. W003 TaxID=2867012 RepID=UPI0021A65DA6|nr:hypothetical protein [Jannaschia sp. W003]UWQ21106.1 hypothetical protein K3554_14190 [Jannaschia sp. W003]